MRPIKERSLDTRPGSAPYTGLGSSALDSRTHGARSLFPSEGFFLCRSSSVEGGRTAGLAYTMDLDVVVGQWYSRGRPPYLPPRVSTFLGPRDFSNTPVTRVDPDVPVPCSVRPSSM